MQLFDWSERHMGEQWLKEIIRRSGGTKIMEAHKHDNSKNGTAAAARG